MNRPARRDHESVVNFMVNRSSQLPREESSFIYNKEDLVTLRPGRENAWLDVVVERMLQFFHCSLIDVRPVVLLVNTTYQRLQWIFCSKAYDFLPPQCLLAQA